MMRISPEIFDCRAACDATLGLEVLPRYQVWSSPRFETRKVGGLMRRRERKSCTSQGREEKRVREGNGPINQQAIDAPEEGQW